MAKKKIEQIDNPFPTLTWEEYWRMRFLQTNIWLEQAKKKCLEEELKYMQKCIDADALKLALAKATKIKRQDDSVAESKTMYNEMKAELEKKLGVSLEDKVIDEVTLEVKPAPKDD